MTNDCKEFASRGSGRTIKEIITGGQTGADQGGWRAARRFGLATAGFMPRGFLVEADGGGALIPRPEFEALYGATEHESAFFRDRTRANAIVSDVMLWFGDQWTPGGKCTRRAWFQSRRGKKNFVAFIPNPETHSITTSDLVVFASSQLKRPVSVFVAGNRESRAPGIGEAVEAHLTEAFRFLGYQEEVGFGKS